MKKQQGNLIPTKGICPHCNSTKTYSKYFTKNRRDEKPVNYCGNCDKIW